jgi:signal transduction histidine kinase
MQSDPDRYSMRCPAIAAILAAGVFLLDTLAPADIAVAVLYSAVVLLSIDFPWRRGILLTGVVCACLTILSYLLSHGESYGGAVLGDCLMSLAAIGLTTVLAIRIRADSDALSEQAKALAQANADLAHATRVITLGELSTSIGHELKQPLAAIATNCDVCARYLSIDPPDLKEIREGVERIKSDVHRATQIINRLRALSQKSVHQKEPVDINALVEETLLLLRREFARRGISLQLDLAPGLPQIVGRQDPASAGLSKSRHECHRGDGEGFDRPRELRIRSDKAGTDKLIVAVQDVGTGINDADTSELFKAFYTTKSEGLGLGLSICRSIVEAHGGTLDACSNEGPGATFQFTLPVQKI